MSAESEIEGLACAIREIRGRTLTSRDIAAGLHAAGYRLESDVRAETADKAALAELVVAQCDTCGGEGYPLYGAAPHECFWRKGPEFTLGQSTLIPITPEDCFVPDLEDGETWADFRYPGACGVFYCPACQRAEYQARWSALVARIGQPPAELAKQGGAG